MTPSTLQTCTTCETLARAYFKGKDRETLLNAVRLAHDVAIGEGTARKHALAIYPMVANLATLTPWWRRKEAPHEWNRDQWAAGAVESLMRCVLSGKSDWFTEKMVAGCAEAARRHT